MLLEKAKQWDVVLTCKNGLIYLHFSQILKKNLHKWHFHAFWRRSHGIRDSLIEDGLNKKKESTFKELLTSKYICNLSPQEKWEKKDD